MSSISKTNSGTTWVQVPKFLNKSAEGLSVPWFHDIPTWASAATIKFAVSEKGLNQSSLQILRVIDSTPNPLLESQTNCLPLVKEKCKPLCYMRNASVWSTLQKKICLHKKD